MGEVFNSKDNEPSKDLDDKTENGAGNQLGKEAERKIREKPAGLFATLLVGSIVVSLLIGYFVARVQENNKRQCLIDNWMRELNKWMKQHGGMVTNPLKEGFKATRSAVEEASHSGARLAQQFYPFVKKQKRSFFGIF
jgi:hypothetical protein